MVSAQSTLGVVKNRKATSVGRKEQYGARKMLWVRSANNVLTICKHLQQTCNANSKENGCWKVCVVERYSAIDRMESTVSVRKNRLIFFTHCRDTNSTVRITLLLDSLSLTPDFYFIHQCTKLYQSPDKITHLII